MVVGGGNGLFDGEEGGAVVLEGDEDGVFLDRRVGGFEVGDGEEAVGDLGELDGPGEMKGVTYDVASLGRGVGDVADDEDVGEGHSYKSVEDEEGEPGREHLGGGTGYRAARHEVEDTDMT